MFTEKEVGVADILLQLPTLIFEYISSLPSPFGWGCKRRRSALGKDYPLSPLSSPRAPSPPSLPGTTNGDVGNVGLSSEKEEAAPPSLKRKVSSPATPLSFSPSESDDKSHSKRKLSVIKRKECLLEKAEELTRRRDLLRGEVENVKRYYQQLEAFNLRLKAKRQELQMSSVDKPKSHLGTGVKSANATPGPDRCLSFVETQFHGQLQLRELPPGATFIKSSEATIQISERLLHQSGAYTCQPATSSGTCNVGTTVPNSSVGPGLLDLNVCPDESMAANSSQSFDLIMANNNMSRALAAALARQKRIQICRSKNSKTRYS